MVSAHSKNVMHIYIRFRLILNCISFRSGCITVLVDAVMIGIILPKTTFVTVLVKGVSRIFVHGVGLQKKLKNASDICLYVFFLRFYSLDKNFF